MRDRRSFGGFRFGASVTNIFGLGEVNFNGADVLLARLDAGKLLSNNQTEIEVDVTYISSNDDTVEGFVVRDRPIFSAQYHPEAAPGPHDANEMFDSFLASLGSHSP